MSTSTLETAQRAPAREEVEAAPRFEQRSDGQLWVRVGERCEPVVVVRCFPWSVSQRFISLRDTDDNEVAFVEDPAALDPESRAALDESLACVDFAFEIIEIRSCEEEVEIRTWEVETRQGRRRFQTRRDEWPREIPGGALLIRDVAGDLFVVREPEKLDRRSQSLLWAFVDE
jgi:hypothetical protein